MKKTNLEQEETEPEAESLHWGEEAESLHWGEEAESLHWGQEADSLQWGEEVESLHSASFLYILCCNLCMQGWTIGFCQGGGHNISSPSLDFCPPLRGGKVLTEGGKHLLPSLIMICLSVLFWHCIFLKRVSPNKHTGIK